MKISIIIPSYQQGQYLEQALLSVINQNRPPDEILVLDGGSTDASVGIIKKYEKYITWWQSKADGGQAAAVNLGINIASGDWIGWVNSDDGLVQGALKEIEERAKVISKAFIYGACYWVNADLSKISFYPSCRKVKESDFIDGATPLCQPATFFTKKMWRDVGGLNESLHYALDYDFFVRALKHGYSSAQTNKCLAFNRAHPLTKTNSGMLVNELEKSARDHFAHEFKSYPKNAFQKYGIQIFNRYPICFILKCLYYRKRRRDNGLPGVPISKNSKSARELCTLVSA